MMATVPADNVSKLSLRCLHCVIIVEAKIWVHYARSLLAFVPVQNLLESPSSGVR